MCYPTQVEKKDINIWAEFGLKEMKRQVQYIEARGILSRAELKNAFWLCTNENLRSLVELAKALEKVDDDVFRYHVTRDKNDFEKWIKDVVRDKELAREISRVKTKETLIRKIDERLNALGKVVLARKALNKRKKAKREALLKRITKKKAKKRVVKQKKHKRKAKRKI